MKQNATRRMILFSIAVLLGPIGTGAAEKKPWKDLTTQVGDLKIHYIEAGAGSRNLVFVHGLTMTAEIWREQIPYFAARGYRVIALDLRSHGLTTKTEVGNTYLQQAADLNAFLKKLGIERPILVGWSSGVLTLLEYVSSPETLQPEFLVLVDGFPYFLRDQDYPGLLTLEQGRNFLTAIQDNREKFADQSARSMFKTRQGEILYKEIISNSLKTSTGAVLSLFFDGLLGDRRPALRRVPSPTLVVVTPENRSLGEYMQSRIPRAKLEVIAEAGHALFLEKPQNFNQILESFFGE